MRFVRGVKLAAVAVASLLATAASAVVPIGATDGAAPYNAPVSIDTPSSSSDWNSADAHHVAVVSEETDTNRGRKRAEQGYQPQDLSRFAVSDTFGYFWDAFDSSSLVDAVTGDEDVASAGGLDFAFAQDAARGRAATKRIMSLAFAGSDKFDSTGLRFRSINGGSEFDALDLTVSAVPEPATWGMLMLGFGLVGAGMRSRKRAMVLA